MGLHVYIIKVHAHNINISTHICVINISIHIRANTYVFFGFVLCCIKNMWYVRTPFWNTKGYMQEYCWWNKSCMWDVQNPGNKKRDYGCQFFHYRCERVCAHISHMGSNNIQYMHPSCSPKHIPIYRMIRTIYTHWWQLSWVSSYSRRGHTVAHRPLLNLFNQNIVPDRTCLVVKDVHSIVLKNTAE